MLYVVRSGVKRKIKEDLTERNRDDIAIETRIVLDILVYTDYKDLLKDEIQSWDAATGGRISIFHQLSGLIHSDMSDFSVESGDSNFDGDPILKHME